MNPTSRSRLYAVQAFYALQIDAHTNLTAVLEVISISEKKGKGKILKLTKEIIDFAVKEKSSIDFIISNFSERTKEMDKINPLVYSILVIALAEMLKFEKTKKPIIISEYISIANDFFGKGELSFVNAVLDKFSRSVI